jgi:hypothetical protein
MIQRRAILLGDDVRAGLPFSKINLQNLSCGIVFQDQLAGVFEQLWCDSCNWVGENDSVVYRLLTLPPHPQGVAPRSGARIETMLFKCRIERGMQKIGRVRHVLWDKAFGLRRIRLLHAT